MADAKLPALTETSVLATDDLVYTVDVSDTTDDATGSSRKLSLTRLGGFLGVACCNGRLTTETGVPISTSDRTAQGTLYFTPYNGNQISIYDGTRWKLYGFTEKSLSLTLTSGKNYDVFIYDNSGTLTLELSAAWTNDTTRADALATQDGISVKSGATTRRLLGTIRASGTNTTEDSEAKRFVWNVMNQVRRSMRVFEATDSWTYGTAAWRQANGSTANQLAIVNGAVGGIIDVEVICYPTTQSGNGIGEDSTTAIMAGCMGSYQGGVTTTVSAKAVGQPGIGYHYYAWLEYAANGTNTTYGDAGFASNILRSGITGVWSC